MLAARIPHLREAVRALYRRLLRRRGRLGAVAAVPAVALAWLIGRSPERAVGAVLADPLAQTLVATVGILLVVIAARDRLLFHLDAWILPETADQRQALADAAGALAQAERSTTVGEIVTRTVRRGCGSPATLLVADDAETRAGGFSAPQARIVPLSRQTAIVHLLETAGGPVRVEPAGRPSVFPLLPPADAAWVTETGADVIVPVPGPGTDVLGVLVVGRRLDGRLVRAVDLPFLEALGAAAGLILARLQLLNAPGAGAGEAPPAEECPVCRCVTAAGAPPGCACGSAYVATEVPTWLAGKFRLTRRLGAGGMGAVYLARDLRLERDVAIKILTARSLDRLMGLHSEAWAMSTVTHPGVAQIYGVESWRGRPCLVVEFLAGGTLEDRLRDGPLAPAAAVSVVTRLADALAALHENCWPCTGTSSPATSGSPPRGRRSCWISGWRTRWTTRPWWAAPCRTSRPRCSPAAPAEAADDVWSLSVVLYEMVAGRQPFAGGTLEEVQRRIRRQRLAADGPDAAAAPTVAVFAASILTAPPGGAAGHRARLRRRAGRGPRDRVAQRGHIFFTRPVRFSPARRPGHKEAVYTRNRASGPGRDAGRANVMDDSNNSVTAGARGALALIGAQRPATHLTRRPRTESRPAPRRPRRVALARANLACVLAPAAPAFAQTTVPAGWSLTPTGLAAGDQFRAATVILGVLMLGAAVRRLRVART